MQLFHLFGFIPSILVVGILWLERVSRHGQRRRTLYLFLSLLVFTINGVFQTVVYTFPLFTPFMDFQVLATSLLLYLVSFLLLEYSIHCTRIKESFLNPDFFGKLKKLLVPFLVLVGLLVVMYLYYPAHNREGGAVGALETILVNVRSRSDAALAYRINMTVLMFAYLLVFLFLTFKSGFSLFDLQKGVIRKRTYPFLGIIALVLAFVPGFVAFDHLLGVDAPFYFLILANVLFLTRSVEEFFFWSLYNLRSDRTRIEQRQHALNLLIRRVISSSEEEDKIIVKETVENALNKARGRMVVDEYNITGMTVYRARGNVLKIDDAGYILGYCSPLVDNKVFKNLDKEKLNDMLLRQSYDIPEIRETPAEGMKDYGMKLIKQVMTTKEPVLVEELPDNYRGLQRFLGLYPIFDGNNFMGFILFFKDSFFRLYPVEKEVLGDLSENLGTIFSLLRGKEIQKERNRLQGEMNTAKNIQTSILPKEIDIPGYETATFMETATEVGGDVFDYVPSPFGNYFGIGDVSGHGLPAGMMTLIQMASLHGALETSKTMNLEVPVHQLYDIVNRVLCVINRDRIGSDKFMTQNYFQEKDGTFYHAGTHEIALHYVAKTDSIVELSNLTDETGFLGISEFVVSDQSAGQFKLESGDMLLLYTDGVIEAKNHSDTQFGIERVKAIIMNNKEKPMTEILQIIRDSLEEFAKYGDYKKHGGHFSDDVTMFGFRRK